MENGKKLTRESHSKRLLLAFLIVCMGVFLANFASAAFGDFQGNSSLSNRNSPGVSTIDNKTYTSSWDTDQITLSWVNGTEISNCSITGSSAGMDNNGTFFWVAEQSSTTLKRYNDGLCNGEQIFNLNAANGNPSGVHWSNEGDGILYVVDNSDDVVYKYWSGNESYIGSFATNALNDNPYGITGDSVNLYLNDRTDDVVYKYLLDGTFVEESFNITTTVDSLGIDINDTAFFIAGGIAYSTYRFEYFPPTTADISILLISPENSSTLSSASYNFTVTYNITDADSKEYVWKNATYHVWNSSGLINETSISLSTNNTVSFDELSSFTLGDYWWSVKAWYGNATYNNYTWADSGNFTFTVGANINSETYNTAVIGSSEETFQANISLLPGTIIYLANLNYNGTDYSGTITSLGGDNYQLSSTFNVPTPATSEDYSFHWVIFYNAGGTISQNLTSHIQTVSPLQAISVNTGSCAAGFTEAIIFEFFNESNLGSINATNVYYNFQYGQGNNTALVSSGNLTDVDSFNICINSTSDYYTGYGEIQYEIDGYSSRRFYLFENTRLTNTTQNQSLYALETADSTAFQITATSNVLTPYSDNYISLLRWYPSLNEYKVVEIGKTDDKGQTVLSVKTNDVDYRIGLYSADGTLIKLLNSLRMVCQTTPCVYSLIVSESDTALSSFTDTYANLSYNPTTKIFTFIWSDPSQDTSSMNLLVYHDYPDADSVLVCNETASGFTGVLTCDVSAYSGILRAEAYRSASPANLISQWIENIRQDFIDAGDGRGVGLFAGLILVISFTLMGLLSPPLVIILSLVALVPLVALGVINFAVFMIIGAIGGVVLHFLKRIS